MTDITKKIERQFIEYYNTYPLCKWPTNACRNINWNREGIACINSTTLFWYPYTPKTMNEENLKEFNIEYGYQNRIIN